MRQLTVVETSGVNPYQNLALEHYLLEHVEEEEIILYLWQNAHTVVIGKNQNAWKECNISTLESDGGRLARRLSGGGAVYHDLGNLNFTFIAHKANYDVARQTAVIVRALGYSGIAAEQSGRNDILVDGRKVSGNAFYEHKGRCYHHGTLLVAVDREKLPRYLNVAPDKLRGKGVASVKSRVANLVEFRGELDIASLKSALCKAFEEEYGGAAMALEDARIDQGVLSEFVAQYSAWDWNHGRRFRFDTTLGERFPWGRVDIELQVDDGHIGDVQLYSDALAPDFIDGLQKILLGVRYDRASLIAAVRSLDGEARWQAMQEDLVQWLETLEL